METTAVALRSGALPVQSTTDLCTIGTAIAQSGMFGINNPGAGLVIAATCHGQGISLLEFARTYHIIDGKPSMRADAMLAEFRKRGGKMRITENSLERAAAEFEFEGNLFCGSFSMDDARRTGDCFKGDGKTLKHNWAARPDDMLWARMISRSVRRLCPEIVAGTYTPEEMEDMRPTVAVEPRALTVEDVRVRTQAQAGICPCGSHAGIAWSGLSDEELKAFGLSCWNDPAMTDAHRQAIADEVARRKAAASATVEGGAE